MEPTRVHIAVLAIADDPARMEVATARIVTDRALAAGHRIIARATVIDVESQIRDHLNKWIADPEVDVVIVTGGVESEFASPALRPLITQPVPGFTDLFRYLAFQEIGASAMLSTAEAAQCESTFVFVLPASEGAVRAAMDKLIVPQLDRNTTPKNLVSQMPRLKAAVVDAVPQPIVAEKTATGRGIPAKLPARPATRERPRTGANVIARKPDDPATKPIDLAGLEKQIALSAQGSANDAPTKRIDLGGLPKLPPGADPDLLDREMDEDTATTTQPAPAAKPLPSIIKPSARKPATTPPPMATPAHARKPATTPPPMASSARAHKPATTPPPMASPARAHKPATTPPPMATPAHARKPATTPPPMASPARAHKPATTPPPLPVVRPRPPTAPPQPAPVVAVEPEAEPTAEEWAALRARVDDEPESLDPDAVEEQPQPSPRTRPATAPPPLPAPAPRARQMTPPPPLHANDAPEGVFVYPVQRHGGNRILKLLLLAAVPVIGFAIVVFVLSRQSTPAREPAREPVATAPSSPPAPEPAPATVEPAAVEPAAVEPASVEPATVEPAPVAPAPTTATTKPPATTAPTTRPSTTRPTTTKPTTTKPSSSSPSAADTKPSEPPDDMPPLPAVPAADPGCDEVSCVLEKYARPCCARFRPAGETARAKGGIPEELDRTTVRSSIEKIKPKVIACGEKSGVKGTVKLSVSVAPEGTVREVSVQDAPDAGLGNCVASAMKRAVFGKSVAGGSFVYPFVF